MTKKIQMFGRKSLKQAQQYVQDNPGKSLIILQDSRTRRFAVCSPYLAGDLATKGFRPVESED